MKIIVLEADAVGKDMSYEGYSKFGELEIYGNLPQDKVKETIEDAEIIVSNKLLINESVLAGSKVRMIAEAATGYNNIDVEYCKNVGIRVANVAGYSTDSVAQHTVALLLSVYEKLSYYNDFVKSGKYAASGTFCHVENYFHEIAGKTWGIVGLGAIGRATAKLAKAFGAKVIYYSASGNTYDVDYEAVDFDTLLATSDIISVHCPLTDKTNGLFDAEAFHKMKSSAVLVNVARGPIVSAKALVEALNNNEIMAAGLDVFEVEPMTADNPLQTFKDDSRLILTPHIGWGTVEARQRLIDEVELNIQAFLDGKERNVIV
ncbi:MAG: hydroxyacid dehydrogenase [Lachnospiraceae bacterium]|nr:hydroxyacid dehydrogenase [Lachnospiraceae bacterium]